MREDPEQEARAWLEKLSEVDQERRGYLRLAAKRRTTSAFVIAIEPAFSFRCAKKRQHAPTPRSYSGQCF